MKKKLFALGFAFAATSGVLSCSHLSSVTRSPQSDASEGDDWYNHFGACWVSPDNHDYEDSWNSYAAAIKKKVVINIGHYGQMPVPAQIHEFLVNLSLISPILNSWNAIKSSPWAVSKSNDKNFVELTSSAAFVFALQDPNFISKNQDPIFVKDYSDGSNFKDNFDEILKAIRNDETQKALVYFHSKKLVFVDPQGLASALQLANFFGLPDSIDRLRFEGHMSDLPVPAKPKTDSDIFADAYWDLIQSTTANFLENFPTSIASLDQVVNPDETIPYDDYVVKNHVKDGATDFKKTVYGKTYHIGVREITAIDGVARTLWGEARGCDVTQGLHGYAATGLVMANRTLAIQNSMNGNNAAWSANKQIEQDDVDILLNSDATDSLHGFVSDKSLGQGDFGRRGSSELAASQAVSRPAQFSCWNGYNTHTVNLSQITQLPKGMPDMPYTFKLPKKKNDQAALVNVLCPQMGANVHSDNSQLGWDMQLPANSDQNWKAAVDIATLIVLDPARYRQMYQFSPAPGSAPLYYTDSHINLPGLPRLPVSGMIYTDPQTGAKTTLPLFKAGAGLCNTLRVFSARSKTVYGISP